MTTRKLPVLDAPVRFESFLRPMVWGNRRLADRLGKPLPPGAFGESWELSDHELHQSVVATGPWAGTTLHTLLEQQANVVLGPAASRHRRFPWLVKFLDAHDWLSVQVHPDERAVQRLGLKDGSKTEAWFVLDAPPGSRVYAGLLPGVDERALRSALAKGTVSACLASFEPQRGDCVYLPAGTVHAVGGGVLLAEVQQTSDVTFRLFDWNRVDDQGRRRELHVEQALTCIDWNQGTIKPLRAETFGARSGTPIAQWQPLVRCPYFHLDFVTLTEKTLCGGKGVPEVLIVLDGAGRFDTKAGAEVVTRGQAWLLAAALAPTPCHPQPFLHGLVLAQP